MQQTSQDTTGVIFNGILAQPEDFLVVEDSLFDQKRIKRTLAKSYPRSNVQYATSLNCARDILDNGTVSFVLLDNNLPDGMGANFALELAEDERFAKIPVIMVSDWPSPFMWDKARKAGVLYVLTKEEFHAGYIQSALSKSRNARPV